ncbi:MAG: hypothetical protein U0L05_09165 [Schaedlerella sp.]|nr:hypothetical protein [Schaedlerella sp.]
MLTPENMEKFRVSEVEACELPVAMEYEIGFTEDIIALGNELFSCRISGKEAARNNIRVFQTETGECRFIYFAGHELPYAVTLTENRPESGITRVWFRKDCEKLLSHDTVFVSTLSLEKLMIDTEAMIFHSAYMNYQNSAVLFSAPSETGKSTQANLWEKYRGTYTVNGDRSLLIREKDGWYAYGWPICGNSEKCRNEAYPIRAIVMLKQAKENKVYQLNGFQALREVMEQITVNNWDSEFQIKVMDQLEILLGEVPVYRLECDISEGAVRCLEELIG